MSHIMLKFMKKAFSSSKPKEPEPPQGTISKPKEPESPQGTMEERFGEIVARQIDDMKNMTSGEDDRVRLAEEFANCSDLESLVQKTREADTSDYLVAEIRSQAQIESQIQRLRNPDQPIERGLKAEEPEKQKSRKAKHLRLIQKLPVVSTKKPREAPTMKVD